MWEKSFGIFWAFVLIFVVLGVSSADTTNTGKFKKGTQIMKVGDMSYKYNFSGIENYMKDLKIKNTEVYNALSPDFKKLEAKNGTASSITTGSLIVGGGLIALGFVFQLEETKVTSLGPIPSFESSKTYNYYFGIAGGAVALFGLIIGSSMYPNEKDFAPFIDKHNKINSETPIILDVAYNPMERSFVGTLAFQF